MNAPFDTLGFADRFESAGFGHEQARALATAFGQAQEQVRDGLVTRDHLDLRLAELEGRLTRQIVDQKSELATQIADQKNELTRQIADQKNELTKELLDLKVELVREIGTVGKDVNNRLWSTITIIAGVSTAISATIGAGVALLLKLGGL